MKQLRVVITLTVVLMVLASFGSWQLHEAINKDSQASNQQLLETRLDDTMTLASREIDALLSHVDTQRPFLPDGFSNDSSFNTRFQTSAQSIRDIQSIGFVFFVWYRYITTSDDFTAHMESSRVLNNCTQTPLNTYAAFDVIDDELVEYTADTVPNPALITFLLWGDGIRTRVGNCGGQREYLSSLPFAVNLHMIRGEAFQGITTTQLFEGVIDGEPQSFQLTTVASYQPPIYGEISMNLNDFMDVLVPDLTQYKLMIVDNEGKTIYDTNNAISGITLQKDLDFDTGISWTFIMTQSADISAVRTRPELVVGLLMAMSVIIVVCLFLVMRIMNEQTRIAHAKSATRALSASGVHTLGNLFNRIARYAMDIEDPEIRVNIMDTSGEAGMIMQSIISMADMIGGVMPIVPIVETNLHELAVKIIRGESAKAVRDLRFHLFCEPGFSWTGPVVYFLICFMDMVANARKYSKHGTVLIEIRIVHNSLCMEVVNPGALVGTKHGLDLPPTGFYCGQEHTVTSRQILSRAVSDAETEKQVNIQYVNIVRMHRDREQGATSVPIFEDVGLLEAPVPIKSSGLGLLNLRLIAARLGGAGGIKEISVAGTTCVQTWCCFPSQPTIVTVNE